MNKYNEILNIVISNGSYCSNSSKFLTTFPSSIHHCRSSLVPTANPFVRMQSADAARASQAAPMRATLTPPLWPLAMEHQQLG